MKSAEINLDTFIVVNFKFRLSEVILEHHGFLPLSQVLPVLGVDTALDGALHVHNDDFGVEAAAGGLEEGVVGNGEGDLGESRQLELVEGHQLENNRVALHHVVLVVTTFESFIFDRFNVCIELGLLLSLEASK